MGILMIMLTKSIIVIIFRVLIFVRGTISVGEMRIRRMLILVTRNIILTSVIHIALITRKLGTVDTRVRTTKWWYRSFYSIHCKEI